MPMTKYGAVGDSTDTTVNITENHNDNRSNINNSCSNIHNNDVETQGLLLGETILLQDEINDDGFERPDKRIRSLRFLLGSLVITAGLVGISATLWRNGNYTELSSSWLANSEGQRYDFMIPLLAKSSKESKAAKKAEKQAKKEAKAKAKQEKKAAEALVKAEKKRKKEAAKIAKQQAKADKKAAKEAAKFHPTPYPGCDKVKVTYVPTLMSWKEHEMAATAMGCHLASIHSEKEFTKLSTAALFELVPGPAVGMAFASGKILAENFYLGGTYISLQTTTPSTLIDTNSTDVDVDVDADADVDVGMGLLPTSTWVWTDGSVWDFGDPSALLLDGNDDDVPVCLQSSINFTEISLPTLSYTDHWMASKECSIPLPAIYKCCTTPTPTPTPSLTGKIEAVSDTSGSSHDSVEESSTRRRTLLDEEFEDLDGDW